MRVKSIVAAVVAFASLAAFAERDTAIYRGKLTSDMNANEKRITNVASPSAPGDAANKGYVDSISVVTPQFVTNAANAVVKSATNSLRLCDGAARTLPKYLHALDFADSYPDAAAAYYRSRGNGKTDGGCSAVRDGGFLSRNFDYPFDDRAEFVVRMSAGKDRFASVGVAQVGTNLTEQIVTSGKPSRCYKWLPGATVDGINERGVVAEINVVDGDPQTSGWHTTGDIHPLAAVRWILDNATNAQHAAEYIAANIAFPSGWTQNFHYMIADETATYIVENGTAYQVTNGVPAMTNFRLYGDPKDTTGEGQERYIALTNGANITSQWWTLTYTANGYRASDLPGITGENLTQLFNYWENNPRESHRGESFGDKVWWQSVHTSIYDITNRVLRVAVQEVDDWYVFQVPSSGAKIDAYTKAETDAMLSEKANKNGDYNEPFETWFLNVGEVSANGDISAVGNITAGSDVKDSSGNVLSEKADKPTGDIYDGDLVMLDENGNLVDSGTHYLDIAYLKDTKANMVEGATAGNLASLDEFGDLEDSGIGTNAVKSVVDTYAAVSNAAMWASNTVAGIKIDHADTTFSNEVLKVQVASLSTNITAEVYIAATNACANLGIDPALIPQEGTIGTVGGLLLALAAAVALLRKKTAKLDNSGNATDDFANNLLGKQVAISAMHYALNSGATIQDRAINLVTMTDTRQTITLPSRIVGKTRDLILRVEVGDLATIGGIALALGSTELASWEGDALDFAANKNYLVTVTETKNTAATDAQDAPTFFVRVVEMTAQPTAA